MKKIKNDLANNKKVKFDLATKIIIISSIVIVAAIVFAVYPVIMENRGFSYSYGLDKNGFWKGVKALEHVSLPKYEGISIPKDVHEISEEEIQEEIDYILSSFATENQIKDRPVQDGDTVNIDYVGTIDGEEFEGGSTDGKGTNVTIGETNYIDDFLEQLIGHMPGETINVEVTFPEDYGVEELNGKDAVFVTTINYIVETEMPELTDEFVAEKLAPIYEWKNIEEMKEGIKKELQASAIRNYVQDYIFENSTINSLPNILLRYQEEALVASYRENAKYYNMKLNDFLKTFVGVSSVNELLEKYKEQNTEIANYNLAIQAIAEDSGISVTEEHLRTYFSENLGTEDYSQYEEIFGLPYLKFTVLQDLVLDNIISKAVLE